MRNGIRRTSRLRACMRTPAPILEAAACCGWAACLRRTKVWCWAGRCRWESGRTARRWRTIAGKGQDYGVIGGFGDSGECGCWLLHLKINNVLTSERRRKQSYSVGLTLRGLGSAGGRGYQSIADDLR